jgi:CheY-like chemotaxis protein
MTWRMAESIVDGWRPHIGVIDMDHGDSAALMQRLGTANALARDVVLPVLGLTRRGDLQTKLTAFDLGVDDILTVPFSPEELLARCMVLARRASGTDRPIVPTITLGEMEIDIVHRQVRAASSVIHLSGIEQSLLYLLASRSAASSRGMRSSTRSGGPTSSRRATSSTAISAACASSSKTTIGTHASSPPCRVSATASSRPSRIRAGAQMPNRPSPDPLP